MKSPRMLLISAAGPLCGALACAVVFSTSFAADSPTPIPDPGVWQKHVYSFQFMGFTTTYSCDGLADKLKVLLIAAGARSDSKSMPGVCSRGYGSLDKFAQANLTFYTLAPADPDNNAGARVKGTWRPVNFTVRSPRELALGDCELVDQFRTLVLPMFTTRNIDSHTTCIPHQESGSVIILKFESFAAVPAKPASLPDVHPAAS